MTLKSAAPIKDEVELLSGFQLLSYAESALQRQQSKWLFENGLDFTFLDMNKDYSEVSIKRTHSIKRPHFGEFKKSLLNVPYDLT